MIDWTFMHRPKESARFVFELAANDTEVHTAVNSTWWVQQSWFVEENGLRWRIVVQDQVDCMSGYTVDLDSTAGLCKECLPPTTSAAGSIQCDLCVANFYSQDGKCAPCPTGTTCAAGTTIESIQTSPGYWWSGKQSHHVPAY